VHAAVAALTEACSVCSVSLSVFLTSVVQLCSAHLGAEAKRVTETWALDLTRRALDILHPLVCPHFLLSLSPCLSVSLSICEYVSVGWLLDEKVFPWCADFHTGFGSVGAAHGRRRH
jgi:hypothetical protein